MSVTSNHSGRTRAGVSIAACLLIMLSVTGIAGAASPAPTPTATAKLAAQIRVGFDGFYKVSGWLPVFALARNDGPPINGQIELSATGVGAKLGAFSAAASLPTNSQKQIFFAAPVASSDQSRTVTLTENNQTLLTQSVPLSPLSPQAYLYGLVSPNAGALDVLRGMRQFGGTVAVANLSLADIPPSGPALNDIDALVLDNVATSALTTAQRQTLLAWVSSGGQLVLSGGVGAAQTLAGLPEFAPVTLAGSSVVDIGPALAPWTQSTAPDRTVVAQATPNSGAIIRLRVGNVPLVVDRPLGDGWVTFLAMSVDAASLRDTPGGAAGWGHILTGARHALDGPPITSQPFNNGEASTVYALPQAVLPSGGMLTALIFCYIFLVGPINYLVLRRLDRREFLWLTIPLVSLLFTGSAYVLARQMKGSEILVNTVSIARDHAGTPSASVASISGAVGVFSPGRSTYNVAIGNGLAAAPLMPAFGAAPDMAITAVADGDGTQVRGLHIEKWSMRAFAVHGNVAGAGGATTAPVATALTLHGSTVTGWVRNISRNAIDDVTLVLGNDTTPPATLQPGEQRDVQLTLGGSGSPGSAPGRPFISLGRSLTSAERTRETLLNAEINGAGSARSSINGPTVYAFTTEPTFSSSVIGEHASHQDLTLHVVPAPVTLPGGPTTLPYGFTRRETLENAGASTAFAGSALPLGSTAAFQFQLPANALAMSWTTLHLRIGFARFGAPGPSGPTIALFNWATGAWDTQSGFGPGVNTVPQANRYVDPRGLVRVQITGSNGQQDLQALDISLDGAAQ